MLASSSSELISDSTTTANNSTSLLTADYTTATNESASSLSADSACESVTSLLSDSNAIVLYVSGASFEVCDISNKSLLENCQNYVDGYIEEFYLDENVLMVLNEAAISRASGEVLPVNPLATKLAGMEVRGNVILFKPNTWISLNDDER